MNIDAQVRRLSEPLSELAEHLPQVLSGSDLQIFEQRREHYRNAKVPDALSTRIASFIALRAAPDIVELAAQTRVRLETVARVYFSLGTELALDWIREQIESLEVDGHWQAVARTTLRDNIYELQRTLCLQARARIATHRRCKSRAQYLDRAESTCARTRETDRDGDAGITQRGLPDPFRCPAGRSAGNGDVIVGVRGSAALGVLPSRH